jgi:1,4-alpha-glucan branching enzyme
MGNEFAQGREWNVNQSLDWHLLENPLQQGVWRASQDLNALYSNTPALHDLDFASGGFEWIDCHDNAQSIISYIRRARDGSFVIIVLNFTPVLRNGYRIGVPQAGHYRELFNSDAECYGGSNQGNGSGLDSENLAWMNQAQSILMTIPPLGAVVLKIN